ncbi:hypothetical protein [Streptomyces sp. Ac-502]|uniref:hypothetical protein n=1 Tax=Streptomyces sp. Ac-502 TaxID=3342801 RepID=UPI00386295C2
MADVLLTGLMSPAQAAPASQQDGVVQVDLGPDGAQPDNWSQTRGVSADGRYALFAPMASNLVPGDTNRLYDIFVRDRRTGPTELVTAPPTEHSASAAPAPSKPPPARHTFPFFTNSLSVDGRGTTALFDGGGKFHARRLSGV